MADEPASRGRPLDPERLLPHPDRLPRERPDYREVMEAHHRAVLAGRPGYVDPSTGLFALTAQALWDRGSCCTNGCRHCPYVARP